MQVTSSPKLTATRRHSVQCMPPPRHIEIGTVSLPASSRCVHVSEPREHYTDHYNRTVGDMHGRPVLYAKFAVAVWRSLYDRLISGLRSRSHPQFILVSLVHCLPIPRKSIHNLLNYSVNKQTNMVIPPPTCGGGS